MRVGGQRHAPAVLPTRRSGRVWKISPPTGFDPRTVQPVASRYTDYAIPAHNLSGIIRKYTSAKSRLGSSWIGHRAVWYSSSLTTVGRNLQPLSSTLKTYVETSKTLPPVYQTTRCHTKYTRNPEYSIHLKSVISTEKNI
jgi:hypothetical protein